jgi:cobalt-zinc-cadmium efflux system membrane fusion protein
MKYTRLIICLMALTFGCTKSPEVSQSEAGSEQASADSLIEMGAEAQGHVGLRVEDVSTKQLTDFLQVTGTVQPIDSKVSHVRSLARGRITNVTAQVGDRVTQGQVLAELDNLEASDLITQSSSANAELQRLKAQLSAQTNQADRNRRLLEIGAASTKDYETSLAEQRATEENIRAQESVVAGLVSRLRRFGIAEAAVGTEVITTIQAPFAGVVTHVEVAPGEVVDSGHDLFVVADLSRVWVQAEVYEKDLGSVRLDQFASITLDTYPGERFEGKVTYISDMLDPNTRTARVRCEVPNRDARLKLDMFATIQLPTTFSRMTIAVPMSAVQQVEGRNIVFIRREQTKFEMREVTTGRPVNDVVEIVSGLRNGEAVVTEGSFHLKSIIAGKELGED